MGSIRCSPPLVRLIWIKYARALYRKPEARSASTAKGPLPVANCANALLNAVSLSITAGVPPAGVSSGVAIISSDINWLNDVWQMK